LNFKNIKIFYAFFCAALCVIILLPTLSLFVSYPRTEKFSEIWLLGSNHSLGDYPHNISPGETYNVFTGIGNLMGDLEYYLVTVELRNKTDTSTIFVANPLDTSFSLFEYRAFLADSNTLEKEVSFSFDIVSFENNVSKISQLTINGRSLKIEKTAMWDTTINGFYYQLFFELWTYEKISGGFTSHDWSVQLSLNLSRTPS
jgi:uncharacterized membrane protein